MAKVKAPNEQYTGISASVSFVNGVGETSDQALLDWFRSHGYEVEEEVLKEANENPEADLDKMTAPQLKAYAEKNEIDLGDATKKEDILSAIKAAQQLPADE